MDDRHVLNGALAACLLAALTACQTYDRPAGGRADAPSDRGGTERPTGSVNPPAGSGSTGGPHEGQRGNVPPGTSRDGLPPDGGAIVDPSGAATGTPPPRGMR